MYSTDKLLKLVEEGIASLPLNREPNRLYAPIAYSMQEGGKRVRPVVLMLSANLFTDDIEFTLPAALGVEMFHNFTLLHDDIMDNSPTRRGRDAVHKKWNSNIAILSGDAMLIYAYNLILSTQSSRLDEIMRIFNRFSLEICEGQQFDMDFESKEKISKSDYLNMIRLKTSVLIAGAMEMGAVLGNALEEDCKRMYDLGLNIGMAFQLQDDILDAYSTPDILGKPIGGDIVEGKKSYLVVKCGEVCSDEDKLLLYSILKREDMSREAKICAVKSIYDRNGIKDLCEEDVKHYFEKALEIISHINVDGSRKDIIINFAQRLINRVK